MELAEITSGLGVVTGKRVEEAIDKLLSLPQAKCEVLHHFPEPGVYLREARFPAGAMVIGHHQNFAQTNIFAKGRVTMLLDDGTTLELKAPMSYHGKPGRKIGYIHEDVVWYNVYQTDEQDIEKLEAYYLTKPESFNRRPADERKLLAAIHAQGDYRGMIMDKGMEQEAIDLVVKDESDMVDMPHGTYKWQLGPSLIHGKGIMATADIAVDEEIGVARLGGGRTQLGRFTNHSSRPNARFRYLDNGDIHLYAISPIEGQRGGVVGDEILIDYREPLAQIHNI